MGGLSPCWSESGRAGKMHLRENGGQKLNSVKPNKVWSEKPFKRPRKVGELGGDGLERAVFLNLSEPCVSGGATMESDAM